MKIASVIEEIKQPLNANLESIAVKIKEASEAGAHMVLFPEGAISGFCYGLSVVSDCRMALSLKNAVFKNLSQLAKTYNVALGIGFLEEKDQGLYDSYIFFEKNGNCKDVYRRISSNWHLLDKGNKYVEGESVSSWVVDGLCFSILLGDDLMDEIGCAMVNALDVDICFVPMAKRLDQDLKKYQKQVKHLNTNALLINQLSKLPKQPEFNGGVFEINYKGELEHCLELNKNGILYTEI